MDADTLKKKLHKQNPLMMSPMAFALAACGGGGGEEEITPSLSGVRTLSPTGDELIDMMTTGSYYRSSSTSPVFYGLADGHFGEQWENPDKVAEVLQEVMQDYNAYADVNLVYAGHYDSPNAATEAGVGVIMSFDKFVFESEGSDQVWHVFSPSATDDQGAGIDQIAGDLYINYNASVLNSTSQSVFESRLTDTDFGYAVIMHGMLATVGIKSTYWDWGDESPHIEDTSFASSEDDYTFSASNISYDSLTGNFGEVLGIADILTLMYLYGPNISTNADDNIHNLSNVSEYTVIYDAGGTDTISFNDTDRNVMVALPNEPFTTDNFTNKVSILVGGMQIDADTSQDVQGFLLGEIENVTTGSGNDIIVGNHLDNIIKAGNGDDNVMLTTGEDVIFGGDGADSFYAQGAMGDLYFIGTNTIIKDFEVGVDSLLVADGSKELVFSQNVDGYATYTNEDGVYVVLEGIEGNVLLLGEPNFENLNIKSENTQTFEPFNDQDIILASDGDNNPSEANYYIKSHDIFPSTEYELSDSLSYPIFDQSYAESYISERRDITTAKELPSDPLMLALLHGSNRGVASETHSYWTGTDASKTISYSFVDPNLRLLDETAYTSSDTRNAVYESEILEFSPEQKIEIRKAISEAAKIIDLNFVEVVEENNQVGTLRFGQTTADASSGSAFAMTPSNSNATAGDMWFETEFFADDDLAQGQSSGFNTVLHELGHALSLKHTFDEDEYNSTTLPKNLEFTNYTLMSYTDPDWVWYSEVDPSIYTISNTFMVYDIQALQYLYGPNMDYNSGNNFYSFDEETPFAMSIWDSGGEDLLDFSNFDLGSEIDLNDGNYSTINYAGWEAAEHLGLAFNVFIENVNGTKGQDTIVGNEFSNELNGNRGNDIMYGGDGDDYFDFAWNSRSGNDTMYGGAGDDVFVLYGNDTVIEYQGEGTDTIFVDYHMTFELPDNVEKLVAYGNLNYNLSGNNLNNTLRGSNGNDFLTGGAGADAYVVTQDMGHDTVTDFNISEGDRWFTTLDKAALAISANDQQIIISVDEASSLTLVLDGTIA
jgi:serralysin